MIIHNAYDLLYLHNQLNTIVNIYHYANHYINSMFITLEKQHHILLKSILHTIGKAIFYFPFPSTMYITSISMYFADINILLSISIYSADIYHSTLCLIYVPCGRQLAVPLCSPIYYALPPRSFCICPSETAVMRLFGEDDPSPPPTL